MKSIEEGFDSKRVSITIALLVLMLSIFFFLSNMVQMENEHTINTMTDKQVAMAINSVRVNRDNKKKEVNITTSNVRLRARSAVVYNIRTGDVLYSKNSDKSLPIASLTKLMTALIADETFRNVQSVPITYRVLATDGVSGLIAGDRWHVDQLTKFMLIESSNDAAMALALSKDYDAFIKAMNNRAKLLGMKNTIYHNPTGLDINSIRAGAYASSKDIALLLAYITKEKPGLIEATTYKELVLKSVTGRKYTARNTDKILKYIPAMIGGKTGYTDLAGGNLAIVMNSGINDPIAIVVLGSTHTSRFSDVRTLIDVVIQ